VTASIQRSGRSALAVLSVAVVVGGCGHHDAPAVSNATPLDAVQACLAQFGYTVPRQSFAVAVAGTSFRFAITPLATAASPRETPYTPVYSVRRAVRAQRLARRRDGRAIGTLLLDSSPTSTDPSAPWRIDPGAVRALTHCADRINAMPDESLSRLASRHTGGIRPFPRTKRHPAGRDRSRPGGR
jgi:hypothetical protein